MGVSDPKAKEIFRNPQLACDLLNGGFCNGEFYYKPENMTRLPETSEIVYEDGAGTKKSDEQTPDVVFGYHAEGGDILIIFQLQKNVSLIMPVRENLSTALLYYRQLKEKRKQRRDGMVLRAGAEFLSGIQEQDRLCPVISVVFYYGEEPWDSVQKLHKMLEFPKDLPGLQGLCPDFKINLLHAGNVNPSNFRTGFQQMFELLPHAKDKKSMRLYVVSHPDHFDNLSDEDCDILETFLGFDLLGEKKRKQYRTQKGGYDMCTALRELREEGVQEGISIGEKRGKKNASDAILALVSYMLKNGDADKIEMIQTDLQLRNKMLKKYQISL